MGTNVFIVLWYHQRGEPYIVQKVDFTKQDKTLYLPGSVPGMVQVPPLPFVYVSGVGAPENDAYQQGVAALYSLCYTIKMSKMGDWTPNGYYDYVVPPLEGLWADTPDDPAARPRASWRWTSLIRQPGFVDAAVFGLALEQARVKKKDIDFSGLQFGVWEEGLCVQMLHTGPYASEPESLAVMHAYLKEQGYALDAAAQTQGLSRRHHEIYLKNPQRTAPEKLKTILRLPINHLIA